MKVATWNVNSLRVRLPHVLRWLDANQPDVLALQGEVGAFQRSASGRSFPPNARTGSTGWSTHQGWLEAVLL